MHLGTKWNTKLSAPNFRISHVQYDPLTPKDFEKYFEMVGVGAAEGMDALFSEHRVLAV